VPQADSASNPLAADGSFYIPAPAKRQRIDDGDYEQVDKRRRIDDDYEF
jgi:hypothetical protein